MRGNRGGNSQWAHDILLSLFGEQYLTRQKTQIEPAVDWRISKDNAGYLEGILPNLQATFGAESIVYRVFSQVVFDMKKAVKHDQVGFIRQKPLLANYPETAHNTAVTANIILLTDAYCGSACLDFIDGLKLAVPDFVHIGQPTYADTVYMDIRYEPLPSKTGHIAFSMKVYRDRKRGHNEYFTPTHEWPGDIENTDQIKNWILDNVSTQSH